MIKLTSISLIILLAITQLIHNSSQDSPIKQLECPFTKDPCQWTTSSVYGRPWRWSVAATAQDRLNISFNGAVAWSASQQGKYIEVYQPLNTKTGANADLKSVQLAPKTTTDCFSFYYYIHGEGVNWLELHLLAGQTISSGQPVWRRVASAGDMWHQYAINIPAQSQPYKLQFILSSGYGAIALTKFETMSGVCPTLNSLCDFEAGPCNWTNVDDNNQFTLTSASGANWPTGAKRPDDHSTESQQGHFMLANTDPNRNIAQLSSPLFHTSGTWYCVRLRYWQDDPTATQLAVKASPQAPGSWFTSDPHIPKQVWHRADVGIYWDVNDPIIISAGHIGSGTGQSSIAIDDISFLPRAQCSAPIDCDFNIDLCAWTRDPSTAWVWDHGIGRVERANVLDVQYAPVDQQGGMFVYSDFTQLGEDSAQDGAGMIMNSQYVISTGQMCFTFDYLPLSWTGSSYFEVELLDEIGNNMTSVFRYDEDSFAMDPVSKVADKDRPWTTTSVTIPYFPNRRFRLSVKIFTDVPTTYMAIDNFVYTQGACQSGAATTRAPPPKQKTALSCAFENGNNLCGWTTPDPKTQWKVTSTADLAATGRQSYLVPPTDHTYQSKRGHYAYVIHSSEFGGESQAVMNVTDQGTGPLCFKFWYYIRAEETAKLEVTVLAKTSVQGFPSYTPVEELVRQYGMGEQWQLAQMELNEKTDGYVFVVNAVVSNGIVAIDDISAVQGLCADADPNFFRCDFEGDTARNCSFSPVYQGQMNVVNWQVMRANDTTVPGIDHTLKSELGHVYGIDFGQLRQVGRTSSSSYVTISRYFRPTRQACVTFAYQMNGFKGGDALALYQLDERHQNPNALNPLWYVPDNLGPFWYLHRLTLNSTLKWQLAFDVSTASVNQGVVSIDDVTVQLDRACPPKGQCDFELGDMCMWTSIVPNHTISIL